MHAYRSHTCADLNINNVGETIRLSGWVHRVRDHGGLLFIDLRDHYEYKDFEAFRVLSLKAVTAFISVTAWFDQV